MAVAASGFLLLSVLSISLYCHFGVHDDHIVISTNSFQAQPTITTIGGIDEEGAISEGDLRTPMAGFQS
jgi:hypothetical protein